MQIINLNKLTLIDYPGKIAAVIFLFSCNFKCGYCHNPELVIKNNLLKPISKDDVLEFLIKRKKYLDGVCITGGEPLLNKDIKNLLKEIKVIGYKIKIDSNGSFPERLKELINENLIDYIAMDIKADKYNYNKVCGTNIDLKKIEESIKIIMNSGTDYEFRTTVIKGIHDQATIKKIGEWLKSINLRPKKYFIQNFIPRIGKLINKDLETIQIFTNEELDELKNAAKDYFDNVEIRN